MLVDKLFVNAKFLLDEVFNSEFSSNCVKITCTIFAGFNSFQTTSKVSVKL